MHRRTNFMAPLVAAVMFTACDANSPSATAPAGRTVAATDLSAARDQSSLKVEDGATIVTATGDIAPAVGQFRSLLGGGAPNPNVAGEAAGGRREINWDGVPAALTDNDLFPANFFN